jgi:pimeloyl-ACP methyl ester carboxylesterase
MTSGRRTTWSSRSLTLAAATALVASACTGGSDDSRPTPDRAGADYAGTECPAGVTLAVVGALECGTLTVPQDRTDGSGSVELFVATLTPGNLEAADPVVVLGSDIGTRYNFAGIAPMAQRTGRRVVFMEPRGVGHSRPLLACPSTRQALDWADETGSRPWRAKARQATRRCYASLTGAGIDVAAFDVRAMAADVVDLLTTLRVERANLMTYGSSARISFEVMRSRPDLLRAVVMDTPDLPGIDARAHAATAARRALSRVLRWCADDRQCRADNPDPRTLLDRAVAEVAARPLVVRVRLQGGPQRVVLDAGLVVRAARQTLTDGGSSGVWGSPPALPSLLTAVVARDSGRVAGALLELLGSQGPWCPGYRNKCTQVHVVDEGVANTVLCRDVAPYAGEAPDHRAPPGFREAYDRSWWWDVCDDWPVPPADPAVATPVASDVPVLVLVGGLSAPTPAAVVEAQTDRLSNASIVVVPTQSHNVTGDLCTFALRTEWLSDPHQVRRTPACLDEQVDW